MSVVTVLYLLLLRSFWTIGMSLFMFSLLLFCPFSFPSADTSEVHMGVLGSQ